MMSLISKRRVRTPTVIQMEAVECGAAALGIVLAYYGRRVPLEELRSDCGVSRDGSKASNVIKAAKTYGMQARGLKCDTPKLMQLPRPVILFWGFNHFLVYEGCNRSGSHHYLNDPGSGPRKVTSKEFDGSFTGVALVLEPGPDFKTGGSKPGVLPFLLERLRGSEAAFIFAILAALLLVLPGLVSPSLTRIFVDDVLIDGNRRWLNPLLLSLGAVAALQFVLTAMQQWCLLRFRTKLTVLSGGRFIQHLLRLPMRYYAQRFSGELVSRLTMTAQISELVGGQFATIALNMLMVLFFGILLFSYSVPLAIISVSTLVLNIIVVKLMTRFMSDRNQVSAQAQGKLMGTSIGGVQTIENIKSGGTEDDFFARWSGFQARYLIEKQALLMPTQITSLFPALMNDLASAIILTWGAFLIMKGNLTIGTLVAFQGLFAQFNSPVTALVQFASRLPLLEANMNRINDVMRAEQDPRYTSTPVKPSQARSGKLSGHVELRGVSFGYSSLEPALIEDFNFTLLPGRRVALVGGSGSGKSTVAKLVSGLYQPWSGEVLFDGQPLADIPRDVLSSSLAVVDQDLVFFSGSIRDNLSLWDHTIPNKDLLQACRDAEIAEVIVNRSGGFDSEISEGGANFSGGQRQRLEIARALAVRPTILVLDEATSALDATTEALIDARLRRRGCSCLIVAHRLSTIRDADEIIVMERGKVVERGTYEQLMASQGSFKALMEA